MHVKSSFPKTLSLNMTLALQVAILGMAPIAFWKRALHIVVVAKVVVGQVSGSRPNRYARQKRVTAKRYARQPSTWALVRSLAHPRRPLANNT